jgi:hypothetical protein
MAVDWVAVAVDWVAVDGCGSEWWMAVAVVVAVSVAGWQRTYIDNGRQWQWQWITVAVAVDDSGSGWQWQL